MSVVLNAAMHFMYRLTPGFSGDMEHIDHSTLYIGWHNPMHQGIFCIAIYTGINAYIT